MVVRKDERKVAQRDRRMADSMDKMMGYCLDLKWVEKMVAGWVATKAVKKALRLVAPTELK